MNEDIFVLIEHVQGQVTDLSYSLLAQAKNIAHAGGKTIALLFGSECAGFAKDLAADEAWVMEDDRLADFTGEAYAQALEGLVRDYQPRLVLMGDSTIGSDIAGLLSVRLGLPLISNCRKILEEGDCLTYLSAIFSGKMVAEGIIPSQTCLVLMIPGAFHPEDGKSTQPPLVKQLPKITFPAARVSVSKFVQPISEDVDITREPILVSVGRGIERQDNLEVAEELAKALGGSLCATRPVVDQGWLASSRLVGKSGKVVKPKVYLALGISGAPEHTEAITGSEMIIAINTDPAAPIFNIARYGAQVDLLDLAPILTEKINQAK